jgi:hypothetical protein
MRVDRVTKANSARQTASLAMLGVLILPITATYAVHLARHAERVKAVPMPSIRKKPASRTVQTQALFSFTDRQRSVKFQCSLDGLRFKPCSSPMRYGVIETKTRCSKHVTKRRRARPKRCRAARKRSGRPLAPGAHTFRVRARTRAGRLSRPASYTWTIGAGTPSPPSTSSSPPSSPSAPASPAGQSFSISGSPTGALYPGGSPLTIPLTLRNPAGVPIDVTALTVAVTGSPAGCEGAQNLTVTQSGVSAAAPVVVPANGSVTLPAQGVSAPTIGLLDLPINQDACKGATFSLSYTGSAHS